MHSTCKLEGMQSTTYISIRIVEYSIDDLFGEGKRIWFVLFNQNGSQCFPKQSNGDGIESKAIIRNPDAFEILM
jgi:hypothetical protein